MEKVFASPSKYVQGKGVLTTGIAHIKALGVNALLLCDDIVWEIVGETFNDQLKKVGGSLWRKYLQVRQNMYKEKVC